MIGLKRTRSENTCRSTAFLARFSDAVLNCDIACRLTCEFDIESDVLVMTSSELSDPQVYLDGEGKVRRRPGRPRKDPRGTQAEIRAMENAAKREKERLEAEAQSELARGNRAYVQNYTSALFGENKVMIGEILIGMLEHSIEVCGSANLAMTSDELRSEATNCLADEVRKLISPSGVIEWQARKLQEFMTHGGAPSAPQVVPSRPAAAQAPLELGSGSAPIEDGKIDIQALMEAGLPGYDDL